MITDNNQLPDMIPDSVMKCQRSIYEHFDTSEHHVYSGEELESIIRENFAEEVYLSYKKLRPYAYKADLGRICLLYLYGGLYLDFNMLFVNTIKQNVLKNHKFTTFLYDNYRHIKGLAFANSIMSSEPKSVVMKNTIDIIVDNCRKEYYGIDCLNITGGLAIGKAYSKSIVEGTIKEDDVCFYGECNNITPYRNRTNFAFIGCDGEMIALRMKDWDITKLDIEGVNYHYEFYKNKTVYDTDIKIN
jgi:mannosyltransferase OCH1-like enzyme